MTFCQCGYWATTLNTQTIRCPLCRSDIFVRSKEDQGRYAWRLLHTEPNPTPLWYEGWLREIPSHDCPCRGHWRRITDRNPPDFSSLAAFRDWAVDRHNEVNELLGKPLWYPKNNTCGNSE